MIRLEFYDVYCTTGFEFKIHYSATHKVKKKNLNFFTQHII
jgi:hypothetical protein